MPSSLLRGAVARRHGTGSGPPTNTAPVNTAAPTVTGTPAQGNTLTATPGTWTGTPTPTLSYQWERNGADIGGATALTYVLTVTDVGASVRIRETATNVVSAVSAWSTTLLVPSPQLANTGAAGTNGVTVTAANSGGSGDNAWDAVTIGAAATLTYDSTAGNVSTNPGYKITMGASAVAVTMRWTTSLSAIPSTGRLTGRFYYTPAGSGPRLMEVFGTGGTVLLCAMNHSNTAGVGVRIGDTGNTGRGVGQGVSLTSGTLYRIEFDIAGIGGGTTAGSSSIACYLANTNTLVGPVDTVTSLNFGAVAYDTVTFGVSAGGTGLATVWLDGFLLNASGVMPGAEISSAPLTPKSPGDLTPSATGTLVPVDVVTVALLTPKSPGDLTPQNPGTLVPL